MSNATASTTAVPTGTWKVDTDHSSFEFGVKHVGIAKVKGHFTDFDAVLVVDEDGALRGEGSARAQSLATRNANRDAHLRSPDFFDVERYPELRFVITGSRVTGEDRLAVTGDLTIRDVTRPVTLDVAVEGVGVGAEGEQRLALSGRGSLDRRDFGLTWNNALDGGGILVGNKVELALDVSAVLQD